MEPIGSKDPLRIVDRLQLKTTELVGTAIGFHRDFNRKVWPNNPKATVMVGGEPRTPSYHHEGHVISTQEALNAFFTKRDEGVDPFRINEELQKWNERNPQLQVGLADLPTVFQIAYAAHDLGNLTQSRQLGPNNTLDFADGYLKEGAEERSAALLDELVDRFSGVATNRTEGIKALGKHLIMQTVFKFENVSSDEPFWQMVQVIDQFASYYFTNLPKESYIGGLLNEEKVREEKAPNFKKYLEFPKARLEALVPDEEQRTQIIKIFEMNPYGKTEEDMSSVAPRLGNIEDLDRPVEHAKDIPLLIAA